MPIETQTVVNNFIVFKQVLKQALFPFVTESQSSVGDLSECQGWTNDLLKIQDTFPEQISLNDRYTTLLLEREREREQLKAYSKH